MTKKRKNGTPENNGGSRTLIVVALIIVIGVIVLDRLNKNIRSIASISYSTLLKKVESDQVKEVRVAGQDVTGTFKDSGQFEVTIPDTPGHWDLFKQHGVEMVVASPAGQLSPWYFFLMSLLGTVLFGLWYLIRQARGGGGGNQGGPGSGIFNMGKSRARMFLPSAIKDKFSSVAGADEAKEELSDVVDFLKNPEKYKRLGAKITRGVLLVGEPGNGKTLLARAVAGEANCPFFSISGSDFIEVFVGVGAARVRDLFAQARKSAPSIIFIDEIDAVGRQRGSGLGGGHDEREQTLNQLLTEMDGFQVSDKSVVVLAATNRPDVLDKALLRAGRFDRRVEVPYPDLKSREKILAVHAQAIKIDPAVDLHKIARGTPGFTGADLANLINESAIHASKLNKNLVDIHDFEESRDKIILGKESKTIVMSELERRITAFHEAGHTLVNLLLPDVTDPLYKVTIIPRGRALGVTHSLPDRDKYSETKDEILADVMVALGGRCAEELIFDRVTTGAYSDFKKATSLVRRMVCLFGMSEVVGYSVYEGDTQQYSDHTLEKIDDEVRKILDEQYKKTLNLLAQNKDKLDRFAQELLEKETLYSHEIYTLLDIPARADHRLVE